MVVCRNPNAGSVVDPPLFYIAKCSLSRDRASRFRCHAVVRARQRNDPRWPLPRSATPRRLQSGPQTGVVRSDSRPTHHQMNVSQRSGDIERSERADSISDTRAPTGETRMRGFGSNSTPDPELGALTEVLRRGVPDFRVELGLWSASSDFESDYSTNREMDSGSAHSILSGDPNAPVFRERD